MTDNHAAPAFTKTRIHDVLMPADIGLSMGCTVDVYRRVMSFYLQVFHDHQELTGVGGWLQAAEALTHRTAYNLNPIYPFDNEFPNFPSGFRRAGISEAYGHACAWKTSYEKWQKKKERSEEKNQRRMLESKEPVQFTDRPPQFPCDSDLLPPLEVTGISAIPLLRAGESVIRCPPKVSAFLRHTPLSGYGPAT
ncbi:MAG TPA: hypothetical protein VMW83_01525, partial [Spirochaetia bacterium]|nr:hypothetical protein [Spirochaetia bacterium]